MKNYAAYGRFVAQEAGMVAKIEALLLLEKQPKNAKVSNVTADRFNDHNARFQKNSI